MTIYTDKLWLNFPTDGLFFRSLFGSHRLSFSAMRIQMTKIRVEFDPPIRSNLTLQLTVAWRYLKPHLFY